MPTYVDPRNGEIIKYVPRANPDENEKKYEGRHGLKGIWDSVKPLSLGKESVDGSRPPGAWW